MRISGVELVEDGGLHHVHGDLVSPVCVSGYDNGLAQVMLQFYLAVLMLLQVEHLPLIHALLHC